MKKIGIIISLFVWCGLAMAQVNVEFDKRNFESRKDAFKEAKKQVEEGDSYFEKGPEFYGQAITPYRKANVFNPDNAQLNYRLGCCYLYSNQKDQAIRYLQKAEKLDFKVAPDLHFRMGKAYHITYKFNEAIEEFKKYKNNLSPEDLQEVTKIIEKCIQECETAKKLMTDSVRVFIDNVGSSVNSKDNDYAPLITADESLMIFTSTRSGSTGDKIDEKSNLPFEDIYYTSRDGMRWRDAMNIGEPLNTKSHDATIGLSSDGQQLFIYKSDNGGDIYQSEKSGDIWESPKALPKAINSEFHESSASFSYDNRTIYYSSENSEMQNYGMHDIFFSKKNAKNKWGDPYNIGGTINTPYDEADVFMHPDGRTLYFSSTGHNTMGGYDIFKATLKDDGSWSEPVNLGFPINTPDDDRFFVLAGSGKHGYYSSAKAGGNGGQDIYMITFLGPEKPVVQSNEDNLIASIANPVKEKVVVEASVEIKTTRLTIVKGTVLDGLAMERTPLEAEIEITDNGTGQIISTMKSNSATGKFLLTLPSGKNYGIAVKKEGYLFHSENFDIPATSTYQEIILEVKLLKIVKESKIVLRNVFFDFGKATLKTESYTELDALGKILTDFPKMRIEIGGHTDNKSSREFNLKLSGDRARSVVDYLISKGIDKARLESRGYAFDFPVTGNETEEGRKQNRRVEFKILSLE